MLSTTNNAEQSSKSDGPQSCVDRSRSAASSFLCDIMSLRRSSLHLNHAQHNGAWRFEDVFQVGNRHVCMNQCLIHV